MKEKKIEHYKIIASDYFGELETFVNDWIKKGYEPVGGASQWEDKYHGRYLCQPMVKWKDKI